MKKMMTKLAALMMAVVLLSTICLSAAAKGVVPTPANDLRNMKIAESCPQSDGYTSTTEEAGTGKSVGVFALRLRKGPSSSIMTAFLVKDGSASYILTHSIVAEYAQDGCELMLMGMDGKNHEAVLVGLVPEYELAYLQASGMSDYEPLIFSREPFATSMTVVLSYANSNYTAAKNLEYRSYDMGRFTQMSDLYYAEPNREVTLQWLGCPVLPDKSSMEVQGICSAISDSTGKAFMGLITFEQLVLAPQCALGAVPIQQEEPSDDSEPAPVPTDPVPEEPVPQKTGIDKKYILIGFVLAAILGYYFYNNNNKKKEAQQEQAAANDFHDPTYIVEPFAEGGSTMPAAKWIIRCTSGPLMGRSFPVAGTTLVGRSSGAQVKFPDNAPGISGKHCELVPGDDHVILRDLNSSYGTFLPSGRLNPGTDHKLYAGDTFTLVKQCTFRLEKADTSGEKQSTLTVRTVEGKIYKADASGTLSFGRNATNSVRLAGDNSAVSGTHCVLYREGGKLYLKDLGSTNGTFFSQKERLRPNQAYRVGKGSSFFLATPANTFTITEE